METLNPLFSKPFLVSKIEVTTPLVFFDQLSVMMAIFFNFILSKKYKISDDDEDGQDESNLSVEAKIVADQSVGFAEIVTDEHETERFENRDRQIDPHETDIGHFAEAGGDQNEHAPRLCFADGQSFACVMMEVSFGFIKAFFIDSKKMTPFVDKRPTAEAADRIINSVADEVGQN